MTVESRALAVAYPAQELAPLKLASCFVIALGYAAEVERVGRRR
jgi:hypothetical protein